MPRRDDILDLRTLADEWQAEMDDQSWVGDPATSQWRHFAELCEQLGCDASPDDLRRYGDDYESTLIFDRHFTEYAQELAEDTGAIPADLSWPLYCIDWEAAAHELSFDYTSVTFDGESYWIRAA